LTGLLQIGGENANGLPMMRKGHNNVANRIIDRPSPIRSENANGLPMMRKCRQPHHWHAFGPLGRRIGAKT